MKRLDPSQILELYASLSPDPKDIIEENLAALLAQLDSMAREISRVLNVRYHGSTYTRDGILCDFGPANDSDNCPEELEKYDDEGGWGGDKRPVALVCDDDPSVLTLCRAAIESRGVRCEVANSAEVAWEIFQRERIDIVITDIQLPGEDGFSLLQKIYSAGQSSSRIPAILTISGVADREEASRRVEAMGGLGHLTKPTDWLKLADMVARYCEVH